MDEDLELYAVEVEEEEITDLMNLPPGFKFQPSEEELVIHYLANKAQGLPLPCEGVVEEVDISEYHPQTLTGKYADKEYEGAWYFFTIRERKYVKGTRPKRGGTHGYWKAQDKDTPIIIKSKSKSKSESEGEEAEEEVVEVLGWKQVLKFKETRDRKMDREGVSTRWLMHEYRINQETSTSNDLVMCKIYLSRKDNQDLTGSKPNRNLAQYPAAYAPTNMHQVSDPNQTHHPQQDPNPYLNPISTHTTIPHPQQRQADPIQNYQPLMSPELPAPNLTPLPNIFDDLDDIWSEAYDFLPELPPLSPELSLDSTSDEPPPYYYNSCNYDNNNIIMDFYYEYGPSPGLQRGPVNYTYRSPQVYLSSSWSSVDGFVDERMI